MHTLLTLLTTYRQTKLIKPDIWPCIMWNSYFSLFSIFYGSMFSNAPGSGVGGVLTVFLGSLLKCPNSKHFFFQDGVDEGQRHRPVASQQIRIHRRALDASEHRLSPHRVSNWQYTAVLFEPVAAGEAEAAARDAASSQADRWRGGLLLCVS